MSSQLLIGGTGQVALIVAALGIAATAKALSSVLRIWIEQAFRTRRLAKALEDTRPSQRPEIITAISQLEGQPACRPSDTAGQEELSAHAHPRLPVLIIQDKRVHEQHGD